MLRDLGSWLMTWKDALIPVGVLVGGAGFLFNVVTEALRWRARLSAMYHGSAAFVHVGGAPDVRPLSLFVESGPQAPTLQRDRHVVLLRNESHRPTAILEVLPLTLRHEPVQATKYRHRLGLPLVIPAWGLVKTFIYLDDNDDSQIAWLRFRDMHEKEIDVRVKVSSVPPKWVKATPIGGHPYDDLTSSE